VRAVAHQLVVLRFHAEHSETEIADAFALIFKGTSVAVRSLSAWLEARDLRTKMLDGLKCVPCGRPLTQIRTTLCGRSKIACDRPLGEKAKRLCVYGRDFGA